MIPGELKIIGNVMREAVSEVRVKQRFTEADVQKLIEEVRDLGDRIRELEDFAIAEGKAIRHTYAGREKIIKAL